MTGFSVQVVETRTGAIVMNELPVLGTPDFSRAINDDSTIKISVPVGASGVPAVPTLRSLVAPWRFSLAVSYGPPKPGNPILSYGPIMAHSFSDSSSTLTIGAGSMWALLARRLLINPPSVVTSPLSMDAALDANYLGMTLWGIARNLVGDTLSRGTGYELPIDLPASTVDIHDRNYPIYDLASVGQRLKDLTQEENGPDIDWEPYFSSSSTVRIQMRVGTPALSQVGQELIWDYGSSLTFVDVDSNSSNMITDSFGRTNSSERASEVAWAADRSLVAVGFPVLETVDTSHQSVKDFTTLQGHANESVRFYRNPVETWDGEVVTDVSPIIGSYKPGDSAKFNIQRHVWIPPGLYQQRILGWSNADPGRLKLNLQALQGAT